MTVNCNFSTVIISCKFDIYQIAHILTLMLVVNLTCQLFSLPLLSRFQHLIILRSMLHRLYLFLINQSASPNPLVFILSNGAATSSWHSSMQLVPIAGIDGFLCISGDCEEEGQAEKEEETCCDHLQEHCCTWWAASFAHLCHWWVGPAIQAIDIRILGVGSQILWSMSPSALWLSPMVMFAKAWVTFSLLAKDMLNSICCVFISQK